MANDIANYYCTNDGSWTWFPMRCFPKLLSLKRTVESVDTDSNAEVHRQV